MIPQRLVGLDGADVMPLSLINDPPLDRSRFFQDPSDKDGNDGFDLAGFKKLEKRCLYSVDAGKEAALSSRVSQECDEDRRSHLAH